MVGRALYAIGSRLRGARYAAIPVARRIGLVCVLSGLVASVATIVYVAHLGRHDRTLGTDTSSMRHGRGAGRTSVFGGRGTIGALAGLFALATLRPGCIWPRGRQATGVPACCCW